MPAELQQALDARRWGVLPEAGGLYDQPAGWVKRANTLLNVYDAHHAYQQALRTKDGPGMGEWELNNPDVMRMLELVRDLERALDE